MARTQEPLSWRITQHHITDTGNAYFSVHGAPGVHLSVFVTPDARWHFIPTDQAKLTSYQYQAVKLVIANYILRRYLAGEGA